jgi:hypothetical protein
MEGQARCTKEGQITKSSRMRTNIFLIFSMRLYSEVKGQSGFHILGTHLRSTYFDLLWRFLYGTKCTTAMFDEINRKWTTSPPPSWVLFAGSDAFLPAVCGAKVWRLLQLCSS